MWLGIYAGILFGKAKILNLRCKDKFKYYWKGKRFYNCFELNML